MRAALAGERVGYRVYRLERLRTQCNFTSQQIAATPDQIKHWKKMSARLSNIQMQEAVRKARAKVESQLQFGPATEDAIGDLLDAQLMSGTSVKQALDEADKIYERNRQAFDQAKKSCGKTVSLAKSFGPSRDQDTVGWCFAFASADLMSYKLKKPISAADMAINYFNSRQSPVTRWLSGKKQSEYRGGWEADALKQTAERGFCLESKFNSEDNGNNEMAGALNRAQEIKNSWLKLKTGACTNDLRTVKALFPQLTLADLNHSIVTSTQSSFISKLATEACEPRLKIEVAPKPLIERGPNKSKLFANIDRQLNAGNPLTLAMYSEILIDSDSDGRKDQHAVMAIGRRFNELTGSCEYLIRNSWGSGAFAHDPIYDRDEKGHVWIPREKLNDTVYATVHL